MPGEKSSKKSDQLSYEEYMALKKKKEEQAKREMPKALKIILAIPFILILLFGLFYIPYVLFNLITNPAGK